MTGPNLLLATSFVLLTITMTPSSVSAQAPESPASRFEIGQPFPTLAFPAIEDGRPRSITEFRGQKLILHVFASW